MELKTRFSLLDLLIISCCKVAATFDVELAARWGAAMGVEFRGKGANVQVRHLLHYPTKT